jgi:hypothetical protein
VVQQVHRWNLTYFISLFLYLYFVSLLINRDYVPNPLVMHMHQHGINLRHLGKICILWLVLITFLIVQEKCCFMFWKNRSRY